MNESENSHPTALNLELDLSNIGETEITCHTNKHQSSSLNINFSLQSLKELGKYKVDITHLKMAKHVHAYFNWQKAMSHILPAEVC